MSATVTIKRFEPRQALPSARSVLGHQGIPATASINERTESLLSDACEKYVSLARPQAISRSISHDDFREIYSGEGRNHDEDPLEKIYQMGNQLFLFAATLGEELSNEIERLMQAGDMAEGCLLDSVASEGADCVAELIQNEMALPTLRESKNADQGVLRFSPGYCGWHISGQKRLFEALGPGAIGMKLNERFLMNPLKSVSGLIVIARREDFQFDIGFPFCADCRNPSCQERYHEMLTRTYE